MMRQGVFLMGGRDKIESTNMLAHPQKAILMHSSHHTKNEVFEALRLWRLGSLKIGPIVTHQFPSDRSPEAYTRLLERDEDMLGVVFRWD
jgi:threonine dehydrogenase-like Zn-dependent dehydrogenase